MFIYERRNIMKTTLKILISLSLIIILSSSACDEIIDPDKDKDKGNLIDNERIAQKVANDYSGTDLDLSFTEGSRFTIKSEENQAASNQKIVISLIGNERYFNSKNNYVFDFSSLENEFIFNFEYLLPKNLIKEDITLLIYSTSNSNEQLDAKLIDFTYDETSGLLKAKFRAPSENPVLGKVSKKNDMIKSGKYDRVALSYTTREELAERPRTHKILMPYYAQPGGACWAACAAMLGRAYSAANDRKREMPIIDFLKYLGHSGYNEGIGLYSFRNNLPSAIKAKTSINFETSTFVSKTNLLREILSKLDENKPLILNMNYPGVGGHAILVVGYEIDLISSSKISVKLLYHNPQNVANESMYKLADFDWLMKDKWATEAFQILYSDQAVPVDRAVHSIGMPLKDQYGAFSFIVPVKRQDGKIVEFPVDMQYDKNANNNYVWNYALGNVVVGTIPDSATVLRLKLPVYNAYQAPKNLSLDIRAYDSETGDLLFESRNPKNFNAGESNFESEISIGNFIRTSKETKVRLKVELWDGGNYLDGYTVFFVIAPKPSIEFISSVKFKINVKTICTNKTSEMENNNIIGIPKLLLTGSGKKFSGTMETNYYNAHKMIRNVDLEFDSEVNPKTIKYIKVEMVTYQNYYIDSDPDNKIFKGTYTFSVEMKNIEINQNDKTGNEIDLWRYNNDVCKYFTNSVYKYVPEDSRDCSQELINYRCDTDSEMYIKIK